MTVSIATAYFTSMTAHADRGDLRAVRNNLSESMRSIGMFLVFSTIALAVVAFPFARFYEVKFGDVTAMAAVILAYLPGLVFFSMLFLLQRVFFAFHEQRTVFFLQLVQSVIFVIAAAICAAAVSPHHIAVAIAISTSVAGIAQTIVALRMVTKRLGGMDGRWIVRRHVQYLVFSVVAGLVGLGVVSGMGGYNPHGFGQQSAFRRSGHDHRGRRRDGDGLLRAAHRGPDARALGDHATRPSAPATPLILWRSRARLDLLGRRACEHP